MYNTRHTGPADCVVGHHAQVNLSQKTYIENAAHCALLKQALNGGEREIHGSRFKNLFFLKYYVHTTIQYVKVTAVK